MAFMGGSAITLHISENKSIMEAIGMTLSQSSRRLGLEHARNGAPKVLCKGGWPSWCGITTCMLDTQILQLILFIIRPVWLML